MDRLSFMTLAFLALTSAVAVAQLNEVVLFEEPAGAVTSPIDSLISQVLNGKDVDGSAILELCGYHQQLENLVNRIQTAIVRAGGSMNTCHHKNPLRLALRQYRSKVRF